MARNLKTVADFAREGPQSESQLRWQIFNAAHNGLHEARAIVRIGKRIYVDVPAYWNWVDSGRAAQRVPA